MHRRYRMSDEHPMPETLETIAEKIAELGQSINVRFGKVDVRFDAVDARVGGVDARVDQLKLQLRVEIEAVRGDVRLVAEGLAAQTVLLKRIDAGREELEKRVDRHDLRIRALEPPKPA